MKGLIQTFGRFLILVLLSCISLGAGAQGKVSISGAVYDVTGAPIPGAAVMLQGAAQVGTVTAADGSFSLSVPADAVLEVSFFGFKTEAVPD